MLNIARGLHWHDLKVGSRSIEIIQVDKKPLRACKEANQSLEEFKHDILLCFNIHQLANRLSKYHQGVLIPVMEKDVGIGDLSAVPHHYDVRANFRGPWSETHLALTMFVEKVNETTFLNQ